MKNRIEEIRSERGIRQEEFARQMGVSRQTISSLENGRYNPSILLAWKIAKFFGLTIEDVFNNKRLFLSIFWVILGAVLLILAVTEKLDSLYAGMGGGLLVVGALQIARNLRYRRDPAYREKIDTEVSDERNRFLRMKSWSWAGYITVIAEGIAAVVAAVRGQETVQMVLSYSVCLLIGAYYISYLVLSRKY